MIILMFSSTRLLDNQSVFSYEQVWLLQIKPNPLKQSQTTHPGHISHFKAIDTDQVDWSRPYTTAHAVLLQLK